MVEGPNWKLDGNRQSVTITFPTNPPVAVQWDASAIDEHFRRLGEFRANMKPSIPNNFAPGQLVGAVPDPAWMTEPDAMLGNSLLHIRDPRYGWLHFVIPKEKAKKLAGLLQKQADAPLPGLGQGKAN